MRDECTARYSESVSQIKYPYKYTYRVRCVREKGHCGLHQTLDGREFTDFQSIIIHEERNEQADEGSV